MIRTVRNSTSNTYPTIIINTKTNYSLIVIKLVTLLFLVICLAIHKISLKHFGWSPDHCPLS